MSWNINVDLRQVPGRPAIREWMKRHGLVLRWEDHKDNLPLLERWGADSPAVYVHYGRYGDDGFGMKASIHLEVASVNLADAMKVRAMVAELAEEFDGGGGTRRPATSSKGANRSEGGLRMRLGTYSVQIEHGSKGAPCRCSDAELEKLVEQLPSAEDLAQFVVSRVPATKPGEPALRVIVETGSEFVEV